MSKDFKHWSDITAEKIIREKGDKETYTIASGITPSGTVHFGNFREVITVDLVGRALKRLGKKVNFIFSWDDYDTFRKIPKNMPKQDTLEKFMFQPIVDTPDPFDKDESYARHHQLNFEKDLPRVGVDVNFLYQAKKYRSNEYGADIQKAVVGAQTIRDILNEYRTEPLTEAWLPTSIYCTSCNTDKVKSQSYNASAETLAYECECGHKEELPVASSPAIKLKWRVDWPMRWSKEGVDFEPGGKDHSSQGGSYTTAKEIAKQVYDFEPPVYLQYDFVSIRGGGGKMSSSSGDVITLNNMLEVYEPEIIRWIFASYKSNVDFSIALDSEVIKTYEEFDKMERIALGAVEANEKKTNFAKRIYEASVVAEAPAKAPFRPSFRHLTNIIQIYDHDFDKVLAFYKDEIQDDANRQQVLERCERASFWLKTYADDEFIFSINKEARTDHTPSEQEASFLSQLSTSIETEWDSFKTDKDLHEKIYEIIKANELEPGDVFKLVYQLVINRDKGPKLAGFIRILGQEAALKLLRI